VFDYNGSVFSLWGSSVMMLQSQDGCYVYQVWLLWFRGPFMEMSFMKMSDISDIRFNIMLITNWQTWNWVLHRHLCCSNVKYGIYSWRTRSKWPFPNHSSNISHKQKRKSSSWLNFSSEEPHRQKDKSAIWLEARTSIADQVISFGSFENLKESHTKRKAL